MSDHDRFISILKKHLRSHIDELTDDTKLSTLGLDSMNAINLLLEIEEEFQVIFPDELLLPETFQTSKSLFEVVASLRS